MATTTRLDADYKHTYVIENNLPYAERLCFGDWAVSRPKDWFIAYFNDSGQDVVDQAIVTAEQQLRYQLIRGAIEMVTALELNNACSTTMCPTHCQARMRPTQKSLCRSLT